MRVEGERWYSIFHVYLYHFYTYILFRSLHCRLREGYNSRVAALPSPLTLRNHRPVANTPFNSTFSPSNFPSFFTASPIFPNKYFTLSSVALFPLRLNRLDQALSVACVWVAISLRRRSSSSMDLMVVSEDEMRELLYSIWTWAAKTESTGVEV